MAPTARWCGGWARTAGWTEEYGGRGFGQMVHFAIDYNRTGGEHRPRGAEDHGTSVNQVPGDAPVLVTAGTGVPTSDLILKS